MSEQGDAIVRDLQTIMGATPAPLTGPEMDAARRIVSNVAGLEARLEKAEAEREEVKLPPNLTPEQLGDACLSYRHDFGLMDPDQRFKLRWEAAEWWRCLSRALKEKS